MCCTASHLPCPVMRCIAEPFCNASHCDALLQLPSSHSHQLLLQTDSELSLHKSQAKMLFKKLSDNSPSRCTLEATGNYIFHYAIEDGVCYLVICEKSFSKKLAFGYLEELRKQFQHEYGSKVDTVARPYAFIAFDNTIQKLKRNYSDERGAHRNLHKLNEELQDVQRIMMQNIDEVLDRGEKIDSLSSKASNLSANSRMYLKDAKYLSWQAMMRKYGPIAVVAFIVLLFIYIKFV
eukprot:m.191227 g.191227  ORF g.191227 m.191227 type:complete len:236 (-) comp10592_c1_seq1:5948-6655(-)